jgi:hypothetical protein
MNYKITEINSLFEQPMFSNISNKDFASCVLFTKHLPEFVYELAKRLEQCSITNRDNYNNE